MHTNSALNIPKVFDYYGADKMQMMNSLLFGANQRLIRKLCPRCSIEFVKDGTKYRHVNKKGCEECNNGFKNERQLVFEYFTGSDILSNGDIKLRASIKDLVTDLAKKGVIDETEIYRQCS